MSFLSLFFSTSVNNKPTNTHNKDDENTCGGTNLPILYIKVSTGISINKTKWM